MKLRKGLIATTIALALVVPTTVFAATSTSTAAIKIRGLFGIDASKLTTQQQADVKDYAQKMADLQKSLIDKMVSNGSMTQAQADAQKAQIDKKLANGDLFVGGGHDKNDFNGFKGNGLDTSKLTDAQKTSLLELQKEQLSLENDLAKVLVEQNLITQAQADAIKTKVDAAIASISTANLNFRMFGNGFEGFNMLHGITLTDTQKTALLDWAAKSAAVEKKVVTLYKDAGIITQDQADKMNKQIDSKAADPLSFNKMNKMENFKNGGKHRGNGRGFNTDSDQNNDTSVNQ